MNTENKNSPFDTPQVRCTYWPEMGEGMPAKLFHGHHIVRNSFCLCWLVADDAEAREALQMHNIFPKVITLCSKEQWPEAKWFDATVYSCSIGGREMRRLRGADLIAIRMMLV
jgi:hypothetical protein